MLIFREDSPCVDLLDNRGHGLRMGFVFLAILLVFFFPYYQLILWGSFCPIQALFFFFFQLGLLFICYLKKQSKLQKYSIIIFKKKRRIKRFLISFLYYQEFQKHRRFKMTVRECKEKRKRETDSYFSKKFSTCRKKS